MSKTNALNILSQIEDITENVIASEGKTDDKQLLKEIRAAIKWVNKASVVKSKKSALPIQNVVGSALESDEKVHYEALKDCCNQLLDAVDVKTTPVRSVMGLRLLLNRK